MRKPNNLEKSLIVKEPDTIFSKIINWFKGIFGKNKNNNWEYQNFKSDAEVQENVKEFTIPKAVKLPVREEIIQEPEEQEENTLEYLYKLSDKELDDLNEEYDEQMEKSKSEFLKLENMLNTYRKTIRELKGQIDEQEGL